MKNLSLNPKFQLQFLPNEKKNNYQVIAVSKFITLLLIIAFKIHRKVFKENKKY